MTDLNLKIVLTAENGQLKARLADSTQSVKGLGLSGRQAGEQMNRGFTQARRGVESVSRQLESTKRALIGLFGVASVVRFGRAITQIADEYASANARLRLFTQGQDEFNVAQRETFRIAQLTRTALTDTVNLYGRVSVSVRELGGNQAQVLAITQSVNQALQLTNASQAQQSAVITQFSQALAGGILRAEEFNSIIENSPRLAKALADGLGVTSGALRQLVLDGQVTSAAIVRALLSQRDVLAREFATLPLTVSASFTQLQNAVQRLVGEKTQGSVRSLAGGISLLARNLGAVVDALLRLGAIALAVYARTLIPQVIAATGALVRQAIASRAAASAAAEMGVQVGKTNKLMAGLNLAVAGFVGFQIGDYLRGQFQIVRDAGIYLVRLLLTSFERLKQGFRSIGPALVLAFSATFDKTYDLAAGFVDRMAGILEKVPGSIASKAAASLRTVAQGLRANIGNISDQAAEDLRRIADEADKNVAKIRAGTEDLLTDPFVRNGSTPEQAAPAGPLPGLDQVLAGANGGDTESGSDEADLEQALLAEQVAREAALRDALDAEERARDTRRDLNIRALELEGQDYAAALETLRDDYQQWLRDLGDDAAGAELAKKVFDAEVAQLQADAIEDQASELVARLRRRFDARNTQAENAAPSARANLQQENADDFAQQRSALDALIERAQEISGPTGEALREALTDIRTDLEALTPAGLGVSAALLEIGNVVTGSLGEALGGQFKSILDGSIRSARDLKGAFKDVAGSVIDSIQSMIAKTLAFYAVQQLVGVFSGGDLSLNNQGVLVKTVADGGLITGPGGPTDDRIPALLSNGEYVIRAAQVSRYGRAFFDRLNNGSGLASGGTAAFASGGFVGAPSAGAANAGGLNVQIIN